MNDEQFVTIVKKIDFLTNVFLLFLIKDLEFKNQVVTLNKMGMKESEIVEFLKSTRNKVHSVLRLKND